MLIDSDGLLGVLYYTSSQLIYIANRSIQIGFICYMEWR